MAAIQMFWATSTTIWTANQVNKYKKVHKKHLSVQPNHKYVNVCKRPRSTPESE